MSAPKLIASALLGGFLLTAAKAEGVKRTCMGVLTDMKVIGIQLGDCDLNSMSATNLKRITDVCGEPSGIDSARETHCRISAVVSPHKSIPSENHGYGARVYVAHKLLSVEGRR
jgi:hypothetical protein